MRVPRLFALVALSLFTLSARLVSAADDATKLKFFEQQVRPLLAERCFKCHGEQKQRGGLRLDSRETLFQGGESGAAIVAGKPDDSLLIQAINYESFEMPPDGKLSENEIAILTAWVRDGAFWPKESAKSGNARSGRSGITDEDRQWWAFQPIAQPSVPEVAGDGWSRNQVDRFILTQLVQQQLKPADEADRVTLIRRLYFDLVGLPPSPEEIDRFLADESPRAYEDLVDRLLEGPRYGERWARHWFDLIRFNESDGYRKDDFRPDLWRYRDYVIRAFNHDKPYDQFIREQIAGDELDPENPEARIATGYWRLYLYEYNQRDARTHWQAILDELTDVTGEVFLGFSIGCAKCHDHKFDPILREDYFRLQAYFSSFLPQDQIPVVDRDQRELHDRQLASWQSATQAIRDQIESIRKPYVEKTRFGAFRKFPPDVRAVDDKPRTTWTPLDFQLMDLMQRQVDLELNQIKFKEEDRKRLDELQAELAKFDELKPEPLPVAMTVTDAGPVPEKTTIPGDRRQRDILPGRLTVLDPQPELIEPVPAAPNSTGRRSALARWLTSPDNPLTPRVIVNRVWHAHFGSGIVATPSDFGHLGEKPSHPELLDWLTGYFLQNDQTFKALHRLIVTSATYRQSAFHTDSDHAMRIDPQNRLHWHWNVRRLDAEQIRDALLAVSGELDLQAGGPSLEASKPRRTIYTRQMRNTPDPLLYAFDGADGFNSTAKRNVTTTPTQSLLMINGAEPLGRSKSFGVRIDELAARQNGSPEDRVQAAVHAAWRLAYGREPDDSERASAVQFLRTNGQQDPSAATATAHFTPTNSRAAEIDPKTPQVQWKLSTAQTLVKDEFTLEAIVLLRSIYPDANVRTILSQWDGDTSHPGWNLGVTSAKSKHEPRNLILQLVRTAEGETKPVYEVLASNLRLELDRPYYVAAVMKLSDTSDAGVTFYLKDLSNPDAQLLSASVKHRVTGGLQGDRVLVLGDRDGGQRSRWDGFVDDVRISDAALTVEELAVNDAAGRAVAAFWKFDVATAPGRDDSGNRHDFVIYGSEEPTRSGIALHALTDLCHILLNSNEFLYVD